MDTFRILEVPDIEPYREKLVRFWQRFLVPNYPDSRIEWLYRMNPSGRTSTWLALDKEDGIAGCGSLYPRTFFRNGVPVKVGMAVDFGVDERYRVFGPAVGLLRMVAAACREKGFDMLFVSPNRAAFGVFKRVGFQHIGESTQWLLILKSYDWIVKHVRSEVLSRMFAFPYDRVVGLLFLKYRCFGYRNYIGRVVERCSAQFDELWSRGYRNYGFLPEKTADCLNWYFAMHPERKYFFYCLHDATSSELCGYVIYYKEHDCVFISDMFTEDKKMMRQLLQHFILTMRQQDVPGIRMNFFGSEHFVRTIKSLGFCRLKHFRDYLVFLPPDTGGAVPSLVDDLSSVFLFFK